MTFDALAAGQSVFVDANVFLHYFTMHPRYAPAWGGVALASRVRGEKAAVGQA